MYVTPRTLLAIIRLSQALAKLNFRNEVTMSDVDESLKLMGFSYRSLKRATGTAKEKREIRSQEGQSDYMNQVMKQIRYQAQSSQPLYIGDILKRLNRKGSGLAKQVVKEDLVSILDYYKRIQVLHVDDEEQVLFL